MVNHSRKIFGLFKPAAQWFNDHVRGSGLSGLCMTGYTTISTGMQGAFVERWHKETSSFHLPVGEMMITLHDVQCLLHLPIRGPLLTHSKIQRVEAIDWMMLYLGMEHEVAHFECATTSGPHVRFTTLSVYFEHHLNAAAGAEGEGDELFREYHRGCALRCWYMHVVGAACFVDKSARYVDVAYLHYFMDLDTVHQWNWGSATLAYLNQKLNEASNWRTRQLVGSFTLLTVRFILIHYRIYLFIYVSYLILIHCLVSVSELDHLLLLPHPRLSHRSCVRGRHAQGRQIRSPEGERCGGTIPSVLGPHDARRRHLEAVRRLRSDCPL